MKKMSLFTTAACNLNCKHCIMGNAKSNDPDYEISMPELENFIDITKKSGYKFHFTISGGEPTLWSYFKEGIQMLHNSEICTGMRMFTNAMHIDPLLNQSIAKHINQIRISRYDYNSDNIDILTELYGNRIKVVERREFWFLPNTPLEDTAPAECEYQKWWYYKGHVYACAHGFPLSKKLGCTRVICNPLQLNYAEGLYEKKQEMMQDPCGPCTICTTNAAFKRKAALVKNMHGSQSSITIL